MSGRNSLSVLAVAAVAAALFFTAYSISYAQSANVDAGGNAMCQASWTGYHAACKARVPPPPDAVCRAEANAKNLGTACSGSACSGMCNYPMGGGPIANVCGGLQCGNQPEKASDKGAQQAMDMAKQLMDALKGMQPPPGGGGGAPPGGEPQDFNYDFGTTSSQSSLLGDVLSGSGNNLSAAFGEKTVQAVEKASDKITNTADDIISAILGRPKTDSKQDDSSAGGPDSEASRADDGRTGKRGESGGERGTGIAVKDGEQGVLATMFGQFFGFDRGARGLEQGAFFARLCGSRPWQATFITRILSTNFFDSLCVQYGYTAGLTGAGSQFVPYFNEKRGRALLACAPQKVRVTEYAAIQWDCEGSQSSASGFETGGRASGSATLQPEDTRLYALRCGNGGFAQCVIEVERPRAQIVAHPERVPLGTRTKIFWTSEHSVECTVEGPGLKERGLRGAATTATILNQATFTIVCRNEDGFEVNDTVVVEPGV